MLRRAVIFVTSSLLWEDGLFSPMSPPALSHLGWGRLPGHVGFPHWCQEEVIPVETWQRVPGQL